MSKMIGSKLLKIGLLAWMLVVIWAAFLYAPPAKGFQMAELARIVFFHVPCAMTATVVSVVSAVYALIYLIKRQASDDVKSEAAATLAALYWVLTTVTGSLFARVQWGTFWNFDPKQSAILLLLLIYLAYFALRAAVTDPAKRATVAAGYTLFAAVTMPFLTYILPNSVPSLHPKGVVFSSDGMDATYKTIFWASTFGFLALTLWLFRLQTALGELRLRFERQAPLPRKETAGRYA